MRNSAQASLNNEIANTKIQLDEIISALPFGIFVVDANEDVAYANQEAESLFGKTISNSRNFRCGDFISCNNRDENPNGCGYSSSCSTCPLLNAIRTILTGTENNIATGEAELNRDDLPNDMWIKYHAQKVSINNQTFALLTVENITDEKLQNARLSESEEKFYKAFHASPAVMSITTLADGLFLDVNEPFLRLLGRTREEVIGKKSSDLGLWKQANRDEIISEINRDGYSHSKEISLITESDESIPILWFGDLANINGKRCIIASGFDLRKQKAAEKELIERERRFRDIFDQSIDGILVFDQDGRIVLSNPAACAMYGYSHDEMTGLSGKDIVHPDYYHHFKDFQQQLKSTGSFFAESVDVQKGGAAFNVEVRGSRFAYLGKPHFLAMVRDITERKRIERSLQESEDLFRNLVNGAPEGIFVQAKGRFLFLNPAMVKIFGAESAEDIIGTDLMSRMAPEYHEAIRDRIRSQNKTGKPSPLMDQIYLRIDGSRIPVETTAVPIQFKGQEAHLVFVRDISERKAIQDLRETQLLFSKALNKISETIILSDEPDHILTISNQIVGETLAVDRTLIYKISFKDDRLTGLCEWLRQRHSDIAPTVGEYPLELFRAPFTEIRKTQKHLESHCASIGTPFMMDGSGEMLHGHFKIKSLIWYPFAFDQDGFYVFTINQILQQRQWSDGESAFLESVAKLVSIALMKIKLLDERRRMAC